MKRLAIPLVVWCLIGLFRTESNAQCPSTCTINSPGQPDNGLWIECFDTASCNEGCNSKCVQFKIRNLFPCKAISSVSVVCTGQTLNYIVCQAHRYFFNGSDNWCEWTQSYGTPLVPPFPCHSPDASGNISWAISAPAGCSIGYHQWLFIDYCGPACSGCMWHISFDDGSYCDVDMSTISQPSSGACCAGDQ
jgi:hypothetical protein